MPRKIVLIVLLIATVVWTAFIFANSLDSAEQSTEKSSSATEIVNKVASAIGIKEEIPHSTVRDMAHFTEFAILACLICADFTVAFYQKLSTKRWLYAFCAATSLVLCFSLACVDELLQKISIGRSSQFSDVLLDTLGALTGTATFAICYILTVFGIRKFKTRS